VALASVQIRIERRRVRLLAEIAGEFRALGTEEAKRQQVSARHFACDDVARDDVDRVLLCFLLKFLDGIERKPRIVERTGHRSRIAFGVEHELRALACRLVGVGDGALGVLPFFLAVMRMRQHDADADGGWPGHDGFLSWL
jgi:hypothetical protein